MTDQTEPVLTVTVTLSEDNQINVHVGNPDTFQDLLHDALHAAIASCQQRLDLMQNTHDGISTN